MITHEQPVLYAVDLSKCEALDAFDDDAVAAALADALRGAGATIVQAVSQSFPGAGLTCVLVLR